MLNLIDLSNIFNVIGGLIEYAIDCLWGFYFKFRVGDTEFSFSYWHFLLAVMVFTLLAKLLYNDWGNVEDD